MSDGLTREQRPVADDRREEERTRPNWPLRHSITSFCCGFVVQLVVEAQTPLPRFVVDYFVVQLVDAQTPLPRFVVDFFCTACCRLVVVLPNCRRFVVQQVVQQMHDKSR